MTPRRHIWFTFLAFGGLFAGSAYPQSTQVNGPITGFIYNRASRLVSPVIGVPRSSHLGPSVMQRVDWGSVGPDGNWAYVRKLGQSTFVSGLSTASASVVPIDGLIGAVDRVVWNREGSYALLYSSATDSLQRVNLSGSSPLADSPLDLSPWGRVSALAIDSAGQQIAFGVAGAGVYLASAGQAPALVSSLSKPVALCFDESGVRLYAADLGQQQILEFDSGSGPLPFASLTQPDGSALSPIGLAVSGGSKYLLVADRATQSVLVYDVISHNLSNTISLDFVPSRFEALSSAPSFLLNGDRTGEWLRVLDAQDAPNVYFMPASQEDHQ
jgi:hypothetical protein